MYDDANLLRSVLDTLVQHQGKDVLVVLHSYSGIVGTQAVHGSLSKESRLGSGLLGGILGILYIAAFVLPKDQSPPKLAPWVHVENNGACWPEDAENVFYNDVPEEVRLKCTSKLRSIPVATFKCPLTYLAYEHHPVTYIFCENDQAIPVMLQRQMVSSCSVQFKTASCDSGHSPFLSQPQTVLDVVREMLSSATG